MKSTNRLYKMIATNRTYLTVVVFVLLLGFNPIQVFSFPYPQPSFQTQHQIQQSHPQPQDTVPERAHRSDKSSRYDYLLTKRTEQLKLLNQDPEHVDYALVLIDTDMGLIRANRKYDHGIPNYVLACEIAEYASLVIHSDNPSIYKKGLHIAECAASYVSSHPRLKLRLLKHVSEGLSLHQMDPNNRIGKEIDFLQTNIRNWDNGYPELIVSNDNKRHDPIEWSEEYEKVIHLAKKKAESQLSEAPGRMGYCHRYWKTLKRILKDDYGIEWRSPSEMNSEILFD